MNWERIKKLVCNNHEFTNARIASHHREQLVRAYRFLGNRHCLSPESRQTREKHAQVLARQERIISGRPFA